MKIVGGNNSTNNGMIERQNGFDADMVRAALLTFYLMIKDVKPPELDVRRFWCCMIQHVAEVKREKSTIVFVVTHHIFLFMVQGLLLEN
jgi:hypothetical protein